MLAIAFPVSGQWNDSQNYLNLCQEGQDRPIKELPMAEKAIFGFIGNT